MITVTLIVSHRSIKVVEDRVRGSYRLCRATMDGQDFEFRYKNEMGSKSAKHARERALNEAFYYARNNSSDFTFHHENRFRNGKPVSSKQKRMF